LDEELRSLSIEPSCNSELALPVTVAPPGVVVSDD